MLHQRERVPHSYTLSSEHGTAKASSSVVLRSDGFEFSFQTVSPDVFRVTFTSTDHPLPPFPSVPRRGAKPSSYAPETTTDPQTKTVVVRGEGSKAVVEWSYSPVVSLFVDGVQKPIHRDLHFRSYAADGHGVAHYSTFRKGDVYVGLGEKAAPMNLGGRGFIISASDTFGYDAYRTDPLYKHIPLLINVTPQGCVGIFSASHSRGSWSVGSEIDGMWGHFKVYRQAYGGLEQYLILGKTAADVVRSYAELVGFPLLVPRYMMGYVGGGMKYSMEDDPPASDAILGFIKGCEENDIPVSAFQMSSGYTVAETEPKTRNVFTWNRRRFPDPRAFTKECHARGVRLLANVKPYVLDNHPAYAGLAENNAFFVDPVTQTRGIARLWSAGGGESGEGSHIDFTSRAGFDWWYEGCRSLKDVGIDGMWNDNNEYNIPADDWECALETVATADGVVRKDVGLWGRAMHTELMGKGSHDACVDAAPDERPLVLTRSATAGTMRYASCSWSGDNVTSWEGMRGGNAIALNAGFTLLQCYGHDIGGFEGPQPTPEHLLRWIQLGIHSPRFAINCFKTSPEDNLVGDVIEPWMHPSITPLVRQAIKRRYELIPYTYSLSLASHLTAVPPQRWTGWGYEQDPNVWAREILAGDTQYWFGDALLVAGVYAPGETSARVYLPKGKEGSDFGFVNTHAPHQWLESGKWHEIPSPWATSIPVLARCGSAVPVGKDKPTRCRAAADPEFPNVEEDDWRGVEIFPPPCAPAKDGGATFTSTWLEDDGISAKAKVQMAAITVEYSVGPGAAELRVRVGAVKEGEWEPLWLPGGIDIILPFGEERVVRAVDGNAHVVDKGPDAAGRRVWNISVHIKPGKIEQAAQRGGD